MGFFWPIVWENRVHSGESLNQLLTIYGFLLSLTQHLHRMTQVRSSHENNSPQLRATCVIMICVNFNHITKFNSTKNKKLSRQLVDGEEAGGVGKLTDPDC